MKVTKVKAKWFLILVMTGVYLTISAFSSDKLDEIQCVKTTIDIQQFENNFLLIREDILSVVNNQVPLKHPFYKKSFNIQLLEDLIDNHKMVEKSEVFFTLSGELYIRVLPKIPIMRVQADNHSYYIDYNGDKFPLSPHYTPVVPILSGKVNDQNIQDVLAILKTWKLQLFHADFFSGFYISPNDNITAYSYETTESIEFGKAVNIEQKLLRLKAFYQYFYPTISNKKIKKINLNFEKQVVCEYE
ncbi:cell division protein FtsQ/DivIB [Schleiferia thermophila]|jgi:cell division protein FtsQ|uniref:Cell division protein FtsQ n=1 Tax=Schleiferia thermophila TaxID=884107 RepID=A0A369A5X5_9FLAO|nr:cell division protein FtsQ/DivIB [Schleiferia thermophila]PMB23093.1 hypothetical protein CEN47_19105 [Fischerella thermalis CCMEE 5319]RCX04752.1 cell division protein FtsQ [Schleiferia thermophila]GCD79719.1 cell division protein FtsQ [Schleiferia thermophila]